MHSCIYLGQVRHRRFQPVEHQFQYRLFQMYLDLDELPELFDPYWLWSSRRPALAWFRRRDHLGGARLPLAEAVRDGVQQQTGHRPKGPIRLLTHLRYWGYGFNPVSFYYCFAPDGSQLEAIVAEINNTPWGEQYSYALEVRDSPGNFGHLRFEFSKCFHVSPFMPLEIRYRWHFTTPGPRLAVHMENWKAGHKIFG
ncbi:protein of unknown function DUF1365 [Nitrosococcus halophilus Nc 4]|uniref:DUF1365 domain-containing protein n=1 Tax=Nitrosococcus halophilus (strain Nc4) TaxID=472759 RepID=D5BUV8_NITHN|nr:DUF1365 domain-containing protein [Nitrosococcus halophilus]ADE13508.1 protein of unknown function DUF1365 [Nitrosococcus halophilus Nc 4]